MLAGIADVVGQTGEPLERSERLGPRWTAACCPSRLVRRAGPHAKWATCPLTEMAIVRIVSNPAFSPDSLAPADALGVLARNLAHPRHEFWPDAIGLIDAVGSVAPRLQGHRQIADAYLLGLAHRRRGTLASFDRGVGALATGELAAALEVVPTVLARRPKA